MQHKKILFLLSLPSEDYLENKELIADCESQLQEKEVDVRESVCRHDLQCITNYDIVIIVAHHDKDRNVLVLRDGILPVEELIGWLPQNFRGALDLSACNSAEIKSAVCLRCPQCIVQAADIETRLKVRLVAYPFVVQMIRQEPERDYRDTYHEVLKMLTEAAAANPDDANYADDSLRLGQKLTSVYAPLETKRRSLVPIDVFLHFDTEGEVAKEKRHPGNQIHVNSEWLKGVSVGDTLAIQLRFIPGDDDVKYLQIMGPDSVEVTVTEEILHETFIVRVGSEYKSPNFGCYIRILTEGDKLLKSFPVIIDVEGEASSTGEDHTNEDESKKTGDNSSVKSSNEKRYEYISGPPRNLSEVYKFLKENKKIPENFEEKELLECIECADFSKIYGKRSNLFILFLIDCAKVGFPDEWTDAACQSIGVKKDRLSKRKPLQTVEKIGKDGVRRRVSTVLMPMLRFGEKKQKL